MILNKCLTAALVLTCLALAGCVDEGGRYSNHHYAARDNGHDFGYQNDEYIGRGRGSQHGGIGRPGNDRISQEYSNSGRERSGGNRSNNAGWTIWPGRGVHSRGLKFKLPGCPPNTSKVVAFGAARRS